MLFTGVPKKYLWALLSPPLRMVQDALTTFRAFTAYHEQPHFFSNPVFILSVSFEFWSRPTTEKVLANNISHDMTKGWHFHLEISQSACWVSLWWWFVCLCVWVYEISPFSWNLEKMYLMHHFHHSQNQSWFCLWLFLLTPIPPRACWKPPVFGNSF